MKTQIIVHNPLYKEPTETIYESQSPIRISSGSDKLIRISVNGETVQIINPAFFISAVVIEQSFSVIQRIHQEYDDLNVKLNKLLSFIKSGKAASLSHYDNTLLNEQAVIMKDYMQILSERINLMEESQNIVDEAARFCED